MKHINLVTLVGVSILALANSAAAQTVDENSQVGTKNNEIVVTGTLVRGIAPAGTNVVGLTSEDIQASTATTVSELLTEVPQFGSFNGLQTISGGGNFVTTNRPNLRDLPGFTNAGASATLLMADGNRVVGMGVSSTTPDADFIPPGIVERVDIVPDGGSALYGSDAVAGVVNFITRKRFDGVKADARYGFGEKYHTFDANATIGREWDSGSIWVSYNYAENSAILGRDRSYNFTPEAQVDGLTIRDLECTAPNLRVAASPGGATTLYGALSPAARNTANICNLTDEAGIYPEQKRHSVYAGLNQQLSGWLELDLRAFYYRKESEFSLGQYSGSINIGPAFLASFGFVSSPYSVNLTGSPVETKAVNFALGTDLLNFQNVTLDAWGFRPTFTADIGGGWQVRTTIGYSESKSTQITPRLVPNAILGPLVASGTFNPFSPATVSAATRAALTDWETFGQADQTQFNARAIADGNLFELPGGMVKLAVGAEYLSEAYDSRKGDGRPADRLLTPKFNQSRSVKSVFGELVAPVIGSEGGMSLVVSASGRFDDYSDVGSTFNPKFGATFKPVEWVSIRGAWGKSFVAPSLADSAIANPTALNWIEGATLSFVAPPAVLAANGFPAVRPGQKIMFLLGAQPGLKPETATTWSLGLDIKPPFVPGLRLGANYYNIKFENIIQLVPFINQNQFFSTFAGQAFTLNPTQAQIAAILAQSGSIVGSPCAPQPTCVYGIQDVRKTNIGGFKQDGIDFVADYGRETSFGSIDLAVSGTYILNRQNQSVIGSPFSDDTQYSKLKVRSSVGANVGGFRAQAVWNYNQGFDLDFPTGLPAQTKVDSYSTVDLAVRYTFPDEGALGNLALMVNVNNVFNKYPPVFYGSDIVRNQRGFRNGNTVGRLIQVGVSKQF